MSDISARQSQHSTASSAVTHSLTATLPGPSPCRVPGCRRVPCKLKTHQRYSSNLPRRRVKPTLKGNRASTGDGNSALTLANPPIGRDGVDGMPALPIIHQIDRHSRTLFHHFFSTVFRRLALLFRGPVVAGMEDYKLRMLGTALASESYCAGLIVQAQTDMDIHRHFVHESRESLLVYSNALQAFRRQVMAVQDMPHPMQIELALLSLCTLLSYDAFHERDASAMMHWQGLKQLVALRGGIDSVTVSLQYVVHCDRLCGQRLKMPPAFINAPSQNELLPMPLYSWYGSKFLTLNLGRSSPISSGLVNHCVDVCGMIGLWEVAKGDRAPHLRRTPPSLEYLMRIRDRVDENFTILHADLWNKRSRDKFILWAARILEYPYTWINYVPTITLLHCNHLITYLQGQDFLTWTNDVDVLSWILFALAVVPAKYSGRDWVMRELQKVVNSKFQISKWPEDWQAKELKNNQCFVWCDSMYTNRFREVCMELEQNAAASKDCSETGTVRAEDPASMVERPKTRISEVRV